MNEAKADIVDRLAACRALYDNSAFAEAKDEITRLRAGQFRWIPVSERLPTRAEVPPATPVFVAYEPTNKRKTPYATWWMWDKIYFEPEIVAWAPIPPLPEQSQEDKDEELWRKWAVANTTSVHYEIAFKAGLKAARGAKP